MKKIGAGVFSVLICIVILFSGCDSYRAFMSVESGTQKSWSQSHDFLDGRKSHTLNLGREQTNMIVEVVTEKGSIDITAANRNGEIIVFLENAETGTYEFEAFGKIRMIIEAENHKGSVSVKKSDS